MIYVGIFLFVCAGKSDDETSVHNDDRRSITYIRLETNRIPGCRTAGDNDCSVCRGDLLEKKRFF